MKQLVEDYRRGVVALRETPPPRCGDDAVLVRAVSSLVSLGTERAMIDFGRRSLLGKALARPDLLRRALEKTRVQGLRQTWEEAMGRLDAPVALGYSAAGIVLECGASVREAYAVGEAVSCIGQGFASHAECLRMPANMVCRLPGGVSCRHGAFGMLGSIALHGMRCAGVGFGSRVAVLGLGLLGQLTAQLLEAYACEVIGTDPDTDKLGVAGRGAGRFVGDAESLRALAEGMHGVDAVIVTASGGDAGLLDLAVALCRPRARIVVVGTPDMRVDRNAVWEKEVEITVSRAGGPGALDPVYELDGVDLPLGEVRWTQRRNLEEFLRLAGSGRLRLDELITHEFPFGEAERCYQEWTSGALSAPIGVLLNHPADAALEVGVADATEPAAATPSALEAVATSPAPTVAALASRAVPSPERLSVAVFGAGVFANAALLPAARKLRRWRLDTIVSLSGVRAAHAARRFGFAHAVSDPESVWNDPGIDAVIAATPHAAHCGHVLGAWRHGKALYIEKPLCAHPSELDEIVAAYVAADRLPVTMVGHNRRFSAHARRWKAWLGQRAGPVVAQLTVNAGPLGADHWLRAAEQGRGRIVGEMTHFIDLLCFLCDALPVWVMAERVRADAADAGDDNLVATLRFADGSVGSITYAANGSRRSARETVTLLCDGKTIVSEDYRRSALYAARRTRRYRSARQQLGHREALEHFAKAVGGVAEPPPFVEAVAVMRAAFAIERSLSIGKRVAVAESPR